jgi:HK97 family phage major capsid protein
MLDQFKLDDPVKDVPVALESLRGEFNSQVSKSGATEEQVQKLSTDVAALLSTVEAQKAELRNALRTAPAPVDDTRSVKLDRSALVIAPGNDDLADRDVAPAYRGLGRAQLSLLVAKPERLTDDATTAKKLARLRYVHDINVLSHLRLHASDPGYGGYDSLPLAAEEKSLYKQFSGALADATAGEGSEFVPTLVLSGAIYDRIALGLNVANLFETFPMNAITVKKAMRGAVTTANYGGEQTSDAGTSYATASTIKTTGETFTASKMYALAYESEEWGMDSIAGANYALEELAYAIANKKESDIINGQLTGTIDGGTVEDEFNGLRYFLYGYLASSGDSAVDLSGGVTGEALAAMWGAQGAYGQPGDGAWVCDTNGLARLMVAKNSDGIPLWSVLGAQGPVVTGAIGQVFGRPVVVSGKVPVTLNDSGVIPTPASNKTAIYHVCRPAFKIGERLGVVASYSDHFRFAYGQKTFRAIYRWTFNSPIGTEILAGTDRAINGGFGVATY